MFKIIEVNPIDVQDGDLLLNIVTVKDQDIPNFPPIQNYQIAGIAHGAAHIDPERTGMVRIYTDNMDGDNLNKCHRWYFEERDKAHILKWMFDTLRQHDENPPSGEVRAVGKKGRWEGRDVYRTLAGCPVVMLDEPQEGHVKVMYIHPTNHYDYGQFAQGVYFVESLTLDPDYVHMGEEGA